ncbi:MAG: efflux RND transporter periplasmic adaptor subunit [Rhodanobacteraceae bacterium]
MSRWKIALIIVVVVVVGILGWRMLHHAGQTKSEKPVDAPVPVTVVPVTQKDVPVYLAAQGTVQALNTVTVRPQIGGQLLKLDFAEGKEVKKGEVLAELDARASQAQYDQALAKQKQDEAQVATARSNLSRSQELIKQNYISHQDLDTQQNTLHQMQATVAADAASARDAKVQLDYTTIRAPISGLAGIRQIDPGNVVTTSDAIVVLTQLHPINVLFTLPAQDLAMVRSAQAEAPLPVTALDTAGSGVVASDGVLKVISNQIDVTTGTFQLKSEFPNANDELWPGQFVNVRMQVRTVENGLVVPTQAVQRGPDGEYVYQLQGDNTVKVQAVTTSGQADDTHVLIGNGLSVGDKVVTEGQFRLKPGSKVQPLAPGEVPKSPTAAEIKKAGENSGGGGHGHH